MLTHNTTRHIGLLTLHDMKLNDTAKLQNRSTFIEKTTEKYSSLHAKLVEVMLQAYVRIQRAAAYCTVQVYCTLLLLQYTIRNPTMQYVIFVSPSSQYDVLNLMVTLIGASQPNITNQKV